MFQRAAAVLAGRACVRGLVHAAGHAREQGDRGAGRHQRLHHRPLPRHEDHRGRRQVSFRISNRVAQIKNVIVLMTYFLLSDH